jgi:hypothetical protein
MDIGDDGKATLSALFPERTEIATVEANYAGIQTVRIEIVVKHEVDDPAASITAGAQKKRTTFANISPPLAKLGKKPVPKEPRAGELMLR